MSLGLNEYPEIDSSGVVIPPELPTHPWRRFFARKIDYIVFAVVVVFVLAMIGRPLEEGNRGTDVLFEIVIVLAWIPFEALLLAAFGTTLGKLLLGMKVQTTEGRRLSFVQALQRSGVVAVAGAGCGIGLIALISQWRAWRRLKATGSTAWDEDDGYVVRFQTVPLWRWASIAGAGLFVTVLLFLNGVVIIPFLGSLLSPVQ